MKVSVIAFVMLLVCGCGEKKSEDPMTKTEVANIQVASLVCGTCADNVEKALFQVEGVKAVDVDMDKKIAEVKYVPYQTDVQVLERAIVEAGYDANEKKRDAAAYEKLDDCCKIDG